MPHSSPPWDPLTTLQTGPATRQLAQRRAQSGARRIPSDHFSANEPMCHRNSSVFRKVLKCLSAAHCLMGQAAPLRMEGGSPHRGGPSPRKCWALRGPVHQHLWGTVPRLPTRSPGGPAAGPPCRAVRTRGEAARGYPDRGWNRDAPSNPWAVPTASRAQGRPPLRQNRGERPARLRVAQAKQSPCGASVSLPCAMGITAPSGCEGGDRLAFPHPFSPRARGARESACPAP